MIQSELFQEFEKYFDNEYPKTKEDFNLKHKKMCECWTDQFKNSLGTYGKAQKIVNMTFKYLFCSDYIDKDYFDYCHMPLDSYTLEWFRRKTENEIKFDKWSNLDYDKYVKITEKIFEILQQKPLVAEFKIWPEIQKHLAAEEFYFKFVDKRLSKEQKQEFKRKSLNEKIKSIKECLDNKRC